jgi:hypothetical protein
MCVNASSWAEGRAGSGFFSLVAGSARHWLSSSSQRVKSPSTMAAAPSSAPALLELHHHAVDA